jgi:IS1 family transposase
LDFHQKKENSEVQGQYGEQWVSCAIDPETKVVVAHRVGRRDEKTLTELVKDTTKRLASPLDVLYVSDEWDAYAKSLKNNLFFEEIPEKRAGRGRPRKVRKHPHKDLKYAVVHKTRKGGKVTKVDRKIIFGNESEILKILDESPVSSKINTSFVERNNLTIRQQNRRLNRKTLGYSKECRMLCCQLNLYFVHYNFCRPHRGLRIKDDGKPVVHRTPLMSAGKADKIWSLEELMKYVVVSRN